MGFVLKGWKRKQRQAWRSKDSCSGDKGKVRQNPALYQCCIL